MAFNRALNKAGAIIRLAGQILITESGQLRTSPSSSVNREDEWNCPYTPPGSSISPDLWTLVFSPQCGRTSPTSGGNGGVFGSPSPILATRKFSLEVCGLRYPASRHPPPIFDLLCLCLLSVLETSAYLEIPPFSHSVVVADPYQFFISIP